MIEIFMRADGLWACFEFNQGQKWSVHFG